MLASGWIPARPWHPDAAVHGAFGGLLPLLREAELGLSLGTEEMSGLSPAGLLVGMSPARCPALSAPV